MNVLSPPVEALGYLVAAVCFILALKGLSSPATARRGNLLGAAGAVLACVVVFLAEDLDHVVPILVAIAVGTAVGVPAARRVAMTQMPQLVALFNGVGGAAAALVAARADRPAVARGRLVPRSLRRAVLRVHTGVGLPRPPRDLPAAAARSRCWSVRCRSPGRCVTFAKLQELMTTRPVVFPGGPVAMGGASLVAVGLAAGRRRRRSGQRGVVVAARRCSAWSALAVGVLFVLPVGGADVPIVISLLNAFTGLTVAASGYVLDNALLLVAGTLVGASGTILTRMMASAMGRSTVSHPVRRLQRRLDGGLDGGADRPVRSGSPEDVAILLAMRARS